MFTIFWNKVKLTWFLVQAGSPPEAGHPVQDPDHLPDLWLHRQGEGRVHEQVEGVLQRQRGHCSHDVRHQLRLPKVLLKADEWEGSMVEFYKQWWWRGKKGESSVALLMFLAAAQRAAKVEALHPPTASWETLTNVLTSFKIRLFQFISARRDTWFW